MNTTLKFPAIEEGTDEFLKPASLRLGEMLLHIESRGGEMDQTIFSAAAREQTANCS